MLNLEIRMHALESKCPENKVRFEAVQPSYFDLFPQHLIPYTKRTNSNLSHASFTIYH